MIKNLYERLKTEYDEIRNGICFSLNAPGKIQYSYRFVGDVLDSLNEFYRSPNEQYRELVRKIESGIRRMVVTAQNLPQLWFIIGGCIRTEKDKSKQKRLEAILS